MNQINKSQAIMFKRQKERVPEDKRQGGEHGRASIGECGCVDGKVTVDVWKER